MSFKGVRISGVAKVEKDFLAFLKATQKNPVILNDVGETIVTTIKGSVRARRDEYKMGELSGKSQGLRKALEKYNETSELFRPKRSNLTFTGELLDSMRFKLDSRVAINWGDGNRREMGGTNRVTIFFEGVHSQLTGAKGQKIGKQETNAQIASKLNANPKFRFLFISAKLESTLKNRILAGMRRQLSNYNRARKILPK